MDDAISNTPSKFKAVTAYALFFQCTKAISSSVRILLPLIQQQFSLSPTTLQLMISVYLFVMVPFFPIANVLINRFGLKKLIILSSAGLIFACLIVAITPNFYFILVGRGLMGACVVVLELAVISLFRLSISTSRDGKLFFVSQTWVPSLGLLLGLIIAGVLGHFMAWQFVFYFVALITLLVVLYYFFTSKQEFYIPISPQDAGVIT